MMLGPPDRRRGHRY